MDIVAHALWANLAGQLITRRKKEKFKRAARASSMLGAVAPDLIAFLPGILSSLAAGASVVAYALYRFGQEWKAADTTVAAELLINATPHVPPIVGFIYSFTHSGLLWLVAVGIAYVIVKRVPFFLVGWGTHIALDIFTHDAGHFPTQIIYPLSDFHINATAWSNPVVFVCTYAALLVCYLAVYRPRNRTPIPS